MDFVIDPPPRAVTAVEGGGAFPVRRIFCVGRNYADHVREMGGDAKGSPVFFTKPADAVVENGAAIAYPSNTADLHHEIELVLALGAGGADISEREALTHIYGYAVGCDLTRRDRQAEAKEVGAPWDVAKAFDQSAPLAPIRPASACGHLKAGGIWLAVNGAARQGADLAEMIWSVPEIIAHLSRAFVLKPGDLIFTGTPAGVGPLVPGDVVTGGVEGLSDLRFSIATR
jgi:fumarylpyruvate hydrolase